MLEDNGKEAAHEDPDDREPTRVGFDTSHRDGPSEASLVVIYGPELGRRYPLDQDVIHIGRTNDNTIHIHSDKASRRHARVIARAGHPWLEDLGSTNGTLVNDQRITRTPLANGDIVNIGSVLLKFICGGNAEAHYHEEIYQMTITDNLTGLRNRRYLAEFLDREVARASRYERPLSLALFDIDQFKQINDYYGHLAGDFILRELTADIESMTRREQLVARYGGEEFALVMPETDIGAARVFGERLRQCVAERVFESSGSAMQVTISMGLAAVSLLDNPDPDTLLKTADDALHRAKTSGRNKVLASTD